MSDFTWRAHPALRIALALATGILAAGEGVVAPTHALAVLAVAAFAAAWALRHCGDADVHASAESSLDWSAEHSQCLHTDPATSAPSRRGTAARESAASVIAPVALLLVIASAGSLLGALVSAGAPDVPQVLAIDRAEIVGTIDEAPRHRNGGLELVVACDSIILRSSIARVGVRALVRIDDSTLGVASSFAEGDRITVAGDLRAPRPVALPGDFDERAYLRSRDIALLLEVDDAREAARISPGPAVALHRVIDRVRSAMRDFAREHVGGEEGEIVEALLSGDRDGIDRATKEAFAATGTLHVLAVSGLHVAVIALGLSVLTSWVPDRRWQFVLFALVLGFYTLVTGAGPSIVRAWCMATCFMLARLVGRRTRALNVLALSGVVLLLMRPADLYDIGFQLSFGAVAGIVLFHRRIVESIDARWPTLRDRPWLDRPLRALVLTLAAQTLSMPLLMMHFGAVPALGLVLNLPVVPLTSWAMAASALGVLATPLPQLATAMGASAYAATHLAVAIVQWGATLPYASLAGPSLPAPLALAAISGLVWAAVAQRLRAVGIRALLVVCAIAICTLVVQRDDVLHAGARPRAYLVPTGSGLVIAAAIDDTLRAVVTRDTRSARRCADVLARITGAEQARVTVADSLPSVDATHRALERLPVLLAASDAPLRCARLDGVATLVVGARWRTERMIVLEYNGRWTPLAWH